MRPDLARRVGAFALTVLAGAACGDDDASTSGGGGGGAPPEGAPALAESAPEAQGPYSVGVTTLETTSAGRTIPVEVWYPAEFTELAAESYPLLLGETELVRMVSPLGAVRDAPLSLAGAPHAAVVFSHGNRGWRSQSVYLAEHLASHGFVVAAPDHVGNRLSDTYFTSIAESALHRPEDASAALDLLEAASATWPGALYLAIDPARVAIAGHSFGATTALRVAGATIDPAAVGAACAASEGSDDEPFLCDGWASSPLPAAQRDARFVAALAQSPLGTELLGAPAFASVAVPTMIQGGTHDAITPPEVECIPPYDALTVPAWLMLVEGAGHFTFSDTCTLLDLLGASLEALDDGCGDDDIPVAEAHALANRYATLFLRATLRGDADAAAVLGGEAANPPGVARFDAK